NYESCDFTKRIDQSVRFVRNTILVNFASSAEFSTQAMWAKPIRDLNENEFMDSSRLLVDSIRDLRNTLLQIPQDESDNLLDETGVEQHQIDDQVQAEPNVEITEEINEKLNSFDQERTNFDREVLKWDDNSNDIIVLSKQMCVLMIDMTNFTRGKGPIKSIAGIIQAAKKISEIGTKLEKLCRNLHDECPESQSKKELNRYLNLIPLFCNQLNIGSKVKENIIDIKNTFLFSL
ncbi:catenin alpha, partial [Brachionus plicatilis]